jgi:hypothetical protein
VRRGITGSAGALSEPPFRRFFTGQAASLVGDGMAPVALAFAVIGLGGSPTELGLVLAAQALPLVGFLLVGGVFADRLPRRGVMLGADRPARAAQRARPARSGRQRFSRDLTSCWICSASWMRRWIIR